MSLIFLFVYQYWGLQKVTDRVNRYLGRQIKVRVIKYLICHAENYVLEGSSDNEDTMNEICTILCDDGLELALCKRESGYLPSHRSKMAISLNFHPHSSYLVTISPVSVTR